MTYSNRKHLHCKLARCADFTSIHVHIGSPPWTCSWKRTGLTNMEVCDIHNALTLFSPCADSQRLIHSITAEDLLAFKADVEKCCKFISKMRGKKANGPAILDAFNYHLEQEFPDVFPPAMEVEEEAPVSSKKRGRPSSLESAPSGDSPERQPKKRAAKLAEEEIEAPAATGLSASEKVKRTLVKCPLSALPYTCFVGHWRRLL